jgi:hypothetical protein
MGGLTAEAYMAHHGMTGTDLELMHYGVKGMKWGVRRKARKDAGLTRREVKDYDKFRSMDIDKRTLTGPTVGRLAWDGALLRGNMPSKTAYGHIATSTLIETASLGVATTYVSQLRLRPETQRGAYISLGILAATNTARRARQAASIRANEVVERRYENHNKVARAVRSGTYSPPN